MLHAVLKHSFIALIQNNSKQFENVNYLSQGALTVLNTNQGYRCNIKKRIIGLIGIDSFNGQTVSNLFQLHLTSQCTTNTS